jgi:MFS family permease
MLLVGRILQGIGVCAAGVMSRAIAKDLCKKKDLPRVLSWISIGMATAPAAAPALRALLYFSVRMALHIRRFVGCFASYPCACLLADAWSR